MLFCYLGYFLSTKLSFCKLGTDIAIRHKKEKKNSDYYRFHTLLREWVLKLHYASKTLGKFVKTQIAWLQLQKVWDEPLLIKSFQAIPMLWLAGTL